jgi:U3 small nucleolar RNA-associated protein 19
MPVMQKPILLTDFLMESYDIGGSISLLALNGVFILITKHNLEYPDFYKKLYALCTPDLLHAKYRARFFHLADIFLSSTHLPEYLVAAFAKRLSRLALTGPANALLMVLPFIGIINSIFINNKKTFLIYFKKIRFECEKN